jgi:hypothetical protein
MHAVGKKINKHFKFGQIGYELFEVGVDCRLPVTVGVYDRSVFQQAFQWLGALLNIHYAPVPMLEIGESFWI